MLHTLRTFWYWLSTKERGKIGSHIHINNSWNTVWDCFCHWIFWNEAWSLRWILCTKILINNLRLQDGLVIVGVKGRNFAQWINLFEFWSSKLEALFKPNSKYQAHNFKCCIFIVTKPLRLKGPYIIQNVTRNVLCIQDDTSSWAVRRPIKAQCQQEYERWLNLLNVGGCMILHRRRLLIPPTTWAKWPFLFRVSKRQDQNLQVGVVELHGGYRLYLESENVYSKIVCLWGVSWRSTKL